MGSSNVGTERPANSLQHAAHQQRVGMDGQEMLKGNPSRPLLAGFTTLTEQTGAARKQGPPSQAAAAESVPAHTMLARLLPRPAGDPHALRRWERAGQQRSSLLNQQGQLSSQAGTVSLVGHRVVWESCLSQLNPVLARCSALLWPHPLHSFAVSICLHLWEADAQ